MNRLPHEAAEILKQYAESAECPPLVAECVKAGNAKYNSRTESVECYLFGPAAHMLGQAGVLPYYPSEQPKP